MLSNLNINMSGHVKIWDDEGNVLLDKFNAIHPQNMSRIIARALAGEQNGYIYRIAFGNGGTVTDPTGQIIFNPPNDGKNGSWESRLYNETYSEIVDARSPDFGSDPGSAEPGNIRAGGGSVPEDDPEGGGVVSQEVGTKSNIVISVFLNKNEPSGQFSSVNDFGVSISDREKTFIFDEIGLYSPGKPAAATSGHSSVNVGNKISTDILLLSPNADYSMSYVVDGLSRITNIRTPAGGTGAGGALTYGDLCEGLNSGNWIVSGDTFSDYAFMFITDRTGGVNYPSIANKESYGYLTVQSLSTGVNSSVLLNCNESSATDLFKNITANICSNVNVNNVTGSDAGVINDTIDPSNERERLLTHLVFPPITKVANKALNIVYTLTVSVARTTDSRYDHSQTTILS